MAWPEPRNWAVARATAHEILGNSYATAENGRCTCIGALPASLPVVSITYNLNVTCTPGWVRPNSSRCDE